MVGKKLETSEELQLIMQILPGQARTGLTELYRPEEYKNKSIGELVRGLVKKVKDPMQGYPSESTILAADIEKELDGGYLTFSSTRIGHDEMPTKYAIAAETENKEKHLYLELRAIKPQEGGLPKRAYKI